MVICAYRVHIDLDVSLDSIVEICARSSVWIERGSPKAGVVGSNPTGRMKIASPKVLAIFISGLYENQPKKIESDRGRKVRGSAETSLFRPTGRMKIASSLI